VPESVFSGLPGALAWTENARNAINAALPGTSARDR